MKKKSARFIAITLVLAMCLSMSVFADDSKEAWGQSTSGKYLQGLMYFYVNTNSDTVYVVATYDNANTSVPSIYCSYESVNYYTGTSLGKNSRTTYNTYEAQVDGTPSRASKVTVYGYCETRGSSSNNTSASPTLYGISG